MKKEKTKFWFQLEIDVESDTKFQMEIVYNCLQATLAVLSAQYKWTKIKMNDTGKMYWENWVWYLFE